jgi:hypothetical protein
MAGIDVRRAERRPPGSVLAALPAGLPPEKVYADETASYASNEIAINWQANLVFCWPGNCTNRFQPRDLPAAIGTIPAARSGETIDE